MVFEHYVVVFLLCDVFVVGVLVVKVVYIGLYLCEGFGFWLIYYFD